MPAGRPLKFKTAEELEQKAQEYFDNTEEGELTITGLALALDTSRETLMNYEKKEEFFDTVKRIKTRVEMDYELSLRRKGRAGDIFGLKNFGWKDKNETDLTTNGKELPAPILSAIRDVPTDNSNEEGR